MRDEFERFQRELDSEIADVQAGLDAEMQMSHLVSGRMVHEGVEYEVEVEGNNDVVHLSHRMADPLLGRQAIRLGKPIEPADFYER